jgi:HEAT repeat protein
MARGKTPAKHIRDLAHSDVKRRRTAAEALSEGDERAIYPLLKALRDENHGVQDSAMRSLIAIGGEVVAYMVLPLLREDSYLRNTAFIILKDLGSASVPLLYPLLKDKDEDVRKFSLDLLAEIKDEVSHERILPFFRDPNPNVRASAANAAGALGYKEALPSLIEALRDEEWVCFSAIEALGKLGAEEAVAPIRELLGAHSDALRYAALETLGRIGSEQSSEALLEHAAKTEGYEKKAAIKSLIQIGVTPSLPGVFEVILDMFGNGEWDEKLIALSGLVALGDSRAIPYMVDMAGSLDWSVPENEERLYIIKDALRAFGCSEVLIGLLEDPSIRYRGKVVTAEVLGEMRCEGAVPHLMKLIDKQVRDVRRASMKALGDIDGEAAKGMLMNAVDDHDSHIRRTAVSALGRIGSGVDSAALIKLLRVEEHADVIEEAARALLEMDPGGAYTHLDDFNSHVKGVIGRSAKDAEILIRLSRDADPEVKASAISGLGNIQDERALGRLAEAVRDDEPEVRRAAVMAMSAMNCCYDLIQPLLGDNDMWVRLYAVKALGRCLTQDSLEMLVPMLQDKDIPVVLSTVDTIAGIGGREASEILSPLMEHASEAVKEKVQQVMEIL